MGSGLGPLGLFTKGYELWLQKERDKVDARKADAEIAALQAENRARWGHEEPVYGGGSNYAVNMPGEREPAVGLGGRWRQEIGARRVPGLEARRVAREEAAEGRLQSVELRETRKPDAEYDKRMAGKPDIKNIRKIQNSAVYGSLKVDPEKDMPALPSLNPYFNEVIADVASGELPTRNDVKRRLIMRRPQMIADVTKDYERYSQAIEAGNPAAKELAAYAKMALDALRAESFIDGLFGAPKGRKQQEFDAPLVSTVQRGLTTRQGALGQTEVIPYGQTEEGALLKAGIATTKKVGSIRKVQVGDEIITEEWDGETWNEIGRGPRFAPKGKTEESPSVIRRRQAATLKDVAKAEDIINNTPNDPGIAGYITTFNTLANKPYMYMQAEEPGRFYGTNLKTRKVQLPKIAGKQATAREVTATAEEEGMTVEEVLRHIGALK